MSRMKRVHFTSHFVLYLVATVVGVVVVTAQMARIRAIRVIV